MAAERKSDERYAKLAEEVMSELESRLRKRLTISTWIIAILGSLVFYLGTMLWIQHQYTEILENSIDVMAESAEKERVLRKSAL